MLRSMFSGVSGLRASQTLMDVIGNDIANVNTAGYKSSSVVFQDLLSQLLSGAGAPQNGVGGTNPAQVGLGVKVGSITTNFAQGASQLTGRSTDLSIQGDGFFAVRNGPQMLYTRLGAFSFDANGSLVTPDGSIVQGWLANNGVIDTNAPTGDIRMPLGQTLPPQETKNLTIGGNLPADAPAGTALTTGITVYDTQGKAVKITFTLTKAANRTVLDGSTTSGSTTFTSATANFTAADVGKAITGAGIPAGTTIASVTNGTTVVLSNAATATAAGVQTAIATDGNVWDVSATAPDANPANPPVNLYGTLPSLVFDQNTGLPTNGAAAMPPITFTAAMNAAMGTNFTAPLAVGVGTAGAPDALVQFAGANSFAALSQDGSAIGSLRSFSISNDGVVTGVFSNGRSQALGQVALATFNNPSGLEKAGDSMYRQSSDSGLPQVGTAASGGRGTLSSGTLEMSNVDLAQEFTQLIVAQRGFQANAKVITTSDEMLQDLVNLKR
ncbi:MAG TPA: flagellar hook protein FlgE [Acidimicrobiia bacterium]|nr:flagellar hook protein FlgE [Acidimicrobiia bacterium]